MCLFDWLIIVYVLNQSFLVEVSQNALARVRIRADKNLESQFLEKLVSFTNSCDKILHGGNGYGSPVCL